jgi:hypothetical protein
MMYVVMLLLTRANSVLGAILFFGGVPLFFDLAFLLYWVSKTWKQERNTANNMFLSSKLFSSCYFFRQLCDLINSKGCLRSIFMMLFSCSPDVAVTFASVFQYATAPFIHYIFVTFGQVLGQQPDSARLCLVIRVAWRRRQVITH